MAQYELKKASQELLTKLKSRGYKRKEFPLNEMKVMDFFEIQSKEQMSVRNAIKHRNNYDDGFKERKFTICVNPDKKGYHLVLRIK